MNKKFTPQDMELLAMRVTDLLTEQDLMEDTSVYGNYRLLGRLPHENAPERTTPGGRRVFLREIAPEEAPLPWEQMGTVVITFEGNALYEELNHSGSLGILAKLDRLFDPYDLYPERWDSCSLYAKIWEP